MRRAIIALAMLVPSIASAETNVFKCRLDSLSRPDTVLTQGDEAILGVSSIKVTMIIGLGFGAIADNCNNFGDQIVCKNEKERLTMSFNTSNYNLYYLEEFALTPEKYTQTWSCQPFKLKNAYNDGTQ